MLAAGRCIGPQFHGAFFGVFSLLKVFQVLLNWVRGVGAAGEGGDKNVIHIASMPTTLVLTALSPLCTTTCARMWKKTRCHKRPCLSRPCQKHWCTERCRLFVQHTAHGFATMPKTLVFTALLFLYGLRVADLTFKGLDSELTHVVTLTCRKRNTM